MQKQTKKVIDTINSNNIIGSEITVKAQIKEDTFVVKNKDIMGNLIQSWLEFFLDKNNISWTDKGTQTYPDFILDDDEYLEVKCFLDGASPAFDIANFKTLIDSMLIDPKRLDSDYLIFAYSFGSEIKLSNMYCKKIWEMTSDQKTGKYKGFITSQVKKSTIVNLRPYNFVTKPDEAYNSRIFFVRKLRDRIKQHSNQLIKNDTAYRDENEWFDLVQEKYLSTVGHEL